MRKSLLRPYLDAPEIEDLRKRGYTTLRYVPYVNGFAIIIRGGGELGASIYRITTRKGYNKILDKVIEADTLALLRIPILASR